MQTFQYFHKTVFQNSDYAFRGARLEESVFLDIETTGFRAATSHLYMIGTAVWNRREQAWQIRQWFAEHPGEEAALLRVFAQFILPYRTLIHFNGERFDLPYLKEKYGQYGLECPLPLPVSVDIYQDIRHLKRVLGLSHMNQKSLEIWMGRKREDQFDGGALIKVYRDYIKTRDPIWLDLLCLHNREDMEGMLDLGALYAYRAVFFPEQTAEEMPEKSICDLNGPVREEGQVMIFDLSLPCTVPVCVRREYAAASGFPAVSIELTGMRGVLSLPFIRGSLRYYFPDWKNYYYLPQEDMAVHKSVAGYVNREFRVQAAPDNCYVRKEGTFLLQPPLDPPLYHPAFRLSLKDASLWFCPKKEDLESRDFSRELCMAWIRALR